MTRKIGLQHQEKESERGIGTSRKKRQFVLFFSTVLDPSSVYPDVQYGEKIGRYLVKSTLVKHNFNR